MFAPISTRSCGLAEQLATVVATFFESWVSREIPGGDRARPWLEVFVRVASAGGLPSREPHCWERKARERAAHRHPPTVERGDPEGQGTLGAPGGRSSCWPKFSCLDAWAPVVQPVSPELAYPYVKAHGNLSAASLQGTVVTDAASLAAGGGDP